MGSRRPKSPFWGLGTPAGKIVVSLVLLAVGLLLEISKAGHGEILILVSLLMLLAITLNERHRHP